MPVATSTKSTSPFGIDLIPFLSRKDDGEELKSD
jgi:hypothetical protein